MRQTERLAMAMATYIVIRLLQTFSTIENRDSREWKEKLGLSLAIENGVIIALS